MARDVESRDKAGRNRQSRQQVEIEQGSQIFNPGRGLEPLEKDKSNIDRP